MNHTEEYSHQVQVAMQLKAVFVSLNLPSESTLSHSLEEPLPPLTTQATYTDETQHTQFRSNFGCQRLGRQWLFPAVTWHFLEVVAWIFCSVVGFFTVFILMARQVMLVLYPPRKRYFPRLSLAPWIQAPWTCSHYKQTLKNSQNVCKCVRIHNTGWGEKTHDTCRWRLLQVQPSWRTKYCCGPGHQHLTEISMTFWHCTLKTNPLFQLLVGEGTN